MGFPSTLFLLVFSVFVCSYSVLAASQSKNLIDINEENWRNLLKGEWMVEFYAPWCPACKDLAKAWSSFADWSKDLEIKVAHVDVTANPGLSGRFLVTALPTIYHVRDGIFRSYSGPRDKEDFIAFIEEKKWSVVDPIPSWKYPDSFQMAVVAKFFQLSMAVRDLHNYLIEQKGMPAWASYATFGVATLVLGCILGFLIVCMIDCLFPANAGVKKTSAADKKKDEKEKEKKKKDAAKKEQEKNKSKEKTSADEHASDSQMSGTQSEGENEGEKKEGEVRQRGKKEEKSPVKNESGAKANGKSPQKESAESPKKKK